MYSMTIFEYLILWVHIVNVINIIGDVINIIIDVMNIIIVVDVIIISVDVINVIVIVLCSLMAELSQYDDKQDVADEDDKPARYAYCLNIHSNLHILYTPN